MKTKKQKITDALFNDMRLSPLNLSSTTLMLQLFVSKFTSDGKSNYQVVYGWCIRTSRPDASDEATMSTPEKVYSSDGLTCEITRISIYQSGDIVLKLLNDVLDGKDFKESAALSGINTNKIKFDFNYAPALHGTARIRPIFFNETSPTASRNQFEKYSLYSPFGDTPSFTLCVVSLDKLAILRPAGDFYQNHKAILMKILAYLKRETKLPFETIGSARFGNIEIINGPCANAYERAEVYFENISSEEEVDGIKEKTSKKVQVTVLPNEITPSKHLLINCFSFNGGQVIIDEVKEALHESGETITVEFDTQEPLSSLVVSIWVKEHDKWQIWFKHSAVLLRNISTRIGMVGSSGKVSSPFLSRVQAVGTHVKEDVEKAMEVSRTSYQNMSIGGYKLDPWVDADSKFNSLVESIVPKKSDAAFFPRGWNSVESEHGALAFLGWFKSICDQASHVIIQDPYFDTVGLEFLARTSNSATSFNVITCTQTPSFDDDVVDDNPTAEKPEVPNRASRLAAMIEGFPELFAPLKLTVSDYRNKSGNSKSLLHDRYMIVYSSDEEPKGFHLSNSIQNATQNYPLLITPIPLDVLRSVEQYSIDLLDEGKDAETYDLVRIYDYNDNKIKKREIKPREVAPADAELFENLKSLSLKEDQEDFTQLTELFEQYIKEDSLKFARFWDTFSYFLNNIPSGESALYKAKKWFPKTQSLLLKDYLSGLAVENKLEKFTGDRDFNRSGHHLLYIEDFDESLDASFRMKNHFYENFGFGNYAASRASSLLLNLDIAVFENLLKSLRVEIMERKEKENLGQTVILKVAAILFSDLLMAMYWDDNVIQCCLKSEMMPLRTLAIAIAATEAVAERHDMTFEKVQTLLGFLPFEEQVKGYIALLHETRFDRNISQEQRQSECYKTIFELLKGQDKAFIFKMVDRLVSDRYFELIEAHTTNHLLMPLENNGAITLHDIYGFWKEKFDKELTTLEPSSRNSGIVDLAGWVISISEACDQLEFITSLEKLVKKSTAIIRKPFARGSTAWETEYSRLLMIQTVAMIVLNYTGSETEDCQVLIERLNRVITEITDIKKNYPYFRDYNQVHVYNKQITEKI